MKRFSCDQCNKTYASSQSLWNHRQRCQSSKAADLSRQAEKKHCKAAVNNSIIQNNQENEHVGSGQYEDTSIQTCSSFPDITKPASDPKVSAIIDVIVNNGEP